MGYRTETTYNDNDSSYHYDAENRRHVIHNGMEKRVKLIRDIIREHGHMSISDLQRLLESRGYKYSYSDISSGYAAYNRENNCNVGGSTTVHKPQNNMDLHTVYFRGEKI